MFKIFKKKQKKDKIISKLQGLIYLLERHGDFSIAEKLKEIRDMIKEL